MPAVDTSSSSPGGRAGRLVVRPISAAEHGAFLTSDSAATRSAPVSWVQSPGCGRVEMPDNWSSGSLGWFDGDRLVGSARVVFRFIPRQRRWSLAYLPEGPVIDWSDADLDAWLAPLLTHLRGRHCFGVRIGPTVTTDTWDAATVKAGLADDAARRLTDLTPTTQPALGAAVERALRAGGWRPVEVTAGFGTGQPQYNFVIGLRDEHGGARTDADLLAAMNQQWRRNIKKAVAAGVEVDHVVPDGSPGSCAEELAAFHRLYVETAERDGFDWEPLSYFRSLCDALGAEDEGRVRLWAVHHDGEQVAAAITLSLGPRVWYAYGASSSEHREARASNAMQWAMLRHARDAGAEVYDLRGVTATVSEEDRDVGMIRFKVGTGGVTTRYPGEWDRPLRPLLYRAFDLLVNR